MSISGSDGDYLEQNENHIRNEYDYEYENHTHAVSVTEISEVMGYQFEPFTYQDEDRVYSISII